MIGQKHALEMIARRIQSNIRELEGALTKVSAFASLTGLPVTSQLVDVALADLAPRRREIPAEEIMALVAAHYGVTVERMRGRDRSRQIALPRQVAMYLMRNVANISLPQIGEALGGRDHTTVMYGCEKVAEQIEQDDRLRRNVMEIRERLYGTGGRSGIQAQL